MCTGAEPLLLAGPELVGGAVAAESAFSFSSLLPALGTIGQVASGVGGMLGALSVNKTPNAPRMPDQVAAPPAAQAEKAPAYNDIQQKNKDFLAAAGNTLLTGPQGVNLADVSTGKNKLGNTLLGA